MPQPPTNRGIRVLFENASLLIIDKPAGFDSEDADQVTEAKLLSKSPPAYRAAGLASGVCVVLKTGGDEAEDGRSRGLRANQSNPAAARFEFLAAVRTRRVKKMSVVPKRKNPQARKKKTVSGGISNVRVIRQGRDGMVEIGFSSDTANTRQINQQLQSLGYVALGDVAKWRIRMQHGEGGKKGQPAKPAAHSKSRSRIFLHCKSVTLRDESSGKSVERASPRPAVFTAAIDGRDLIEDRLEVALSARMRLMAEPSTDCYRVFTGLNEGEPGLIVERYADVAVITTQQGKFHGGGDRVKRVARWCQNRLGVSCVLHLAGAGKSGGAEAEGHAPAAQAILGKLGDKSMTVRENGLRLVVRPAEPRSPGIFLDQRDNRARIREMSAGKRVLNTFAYTCGFSVAAAMGGATRVVSLDISTKALDWGKHNFAANKLDPNDHGFVQAEVFSFLGRLAKKNETFDWIILDAPTFARSKKPKRVFSIETDLASLVEHAARALAPQGHLLVATNCRKCSHAWLRQKVSEGAESAGRSVRAIVSTPLPADFAADKDHAKSVIVRLN